MKTYTMTDLCNDFGMTSRAVRFYEERGLLSPTRRGVARLFSRRDYVRLQLIVRGKRFGFSLRKIGELLDLYETPDGEHKQMEQVLPELKFQLNMLREEHDLLGNTISELHASCETIEELLNKPADSKCA